MEVYFNPAVADGPQVVINSRDALLNASKKYRFSKTLMDKIHKIFVYYNLLRFTWIYDDNVALSVFAENSKVTVAKITSCSRIFNDDERRVMLWSKDFKLESFI